MKTACTHELFVGSGLPIPSSLCAGGRHPCPLAQPRPRPRLPPQPPFRLPACLLGSLAQLGTAALVVGLQIRTGWDDVAEPKPFLKEGDQYLFVRTAPFRTTFLDPHRGLHAQAAGAPAVAAPAAFPLPLLSLHRTLPLIATTGGLLPGVDATPWC